MTGRMRQSVGFTLVEVLIAVVVLGLGLLGLAAVFPVLVTEQRDAADKQIGDSARAVAVGLLEAPSSEAQRLLDLLRDSGPFETGSATELADAISGKSLPAALFSLLLLEDDAWSDGNEWILPGADDSYELDETTGLLTISAEEVLNDPLATTRIPVSARVIPGIYQTAGEPRYVWDFAVRRAPDDRGWSGTGTQRELLELALFLRRIDPSIQVPTRLRSDDNARQVLGRRVRLSDIIAFNTTELGPQELRLAVAVDPSTRLPLPDASPTRGVYAAPRIVQVDASAAAYGTGTNSTPRNVIPLAASVSAADRSLILRIGQKLVDQRPIGRARVYEVIDVLNGNPVVRPSLDRSIERPADLEALLFVPQEPVAVQIVRFRP